MPFVLAMIGAVFGIAFESVSGTFNAFVAGGLLGALLGMIVNLKTRVGKLEQALDDRARLHVTPRAAIPVMPAPVVVPPPAPEARTPAPSPTPPSAVVQPPTAAAARAAVSAVPPPAVAATTAAAQPKPSRPVPRRETVEDDPFVNFGASVKRWFTEGNLPAKVGMLVLFVGVAALFKYALDEGLLYLSIPMRLIAVAAIATAGLAFGWAKRNSRRPFALAMQGGALGVLLLTTFAAYRLYHVLPAGTAFVLVAVLVATSAALAVVQHAPALAVLGFVGGYLAPVLLSTGSGDHVSLFTYYAILNAAVFAVASIRPWRALNLVGFVFTFVVGSMWGYEYYRPELFATVEPFLILFFLFYVGIAVLYALRSPGETGAVDGTLLFGTPLIAFALQTQLVEDRDLLAASALAVAALYGVLFAAFRRREHFTVLAEAFAGLALGFATLAIPLAFEAQTTSSAWALEGLAVLWLGLRQGRPLPRFAGVVLQLLAGGAYAVALLSAIDTTTAETPAVLNGLYLSGLLIAIAAAGSAFLFDRFKRAPFMAAMLLLGGVGWWVIIGVREIHLHTAPRELANAWVYFASLTMLLAAALHRALAWPRIGVVALLTVPFFWPLVVATQIANEGPLEHGGALAWSAAAIAGFATLWLLRSPVVRGLGWAHVAYLLTIPLVLGVQAYDAASFDGAFGDGTRAALTILPLMVLTFALAALPRLMSAPLADRFPLYAERYFGFAVLAMAMWGLATLSYAGSASPLRYFPVLNPLELAQLGVIALIVFLARRGALGAGMVEARMSRGVVAALFAWMTLATLRAVHHLAGVPWGLAILDSKLAQTSLTITWSLVGVVALLLGSRRASRPLWMSGAVLMGLVLVKLLLVDRRYTGDVPGIVSFIGVGLLLMLVGYFAPSPPRDAINAPPESAP